MNKKLWISLVAVLVCIMLPVSAFAATWDNVGTWDDLTNAWTDTDDDVVINVTGNIEWLYELLTAAGQNHTINSGNFKQTDVQVGGDGTLTINTEASVNGIAVGDEAKVVVNGDVGASPNGDPQDTFNAAVIATDKADVTINGDIKTDSTGVMAKEEGKVEVNGDIDAGLNGTSAYMDGSVTVNGDVSGTVFANGDSKTVINGNVDGEHWEGVSAGENAEVTVSGNVNGGSSGMDGFSGVYADDNANVEIGGNVTGGDSADINGEVGEGVIAHSNASVTVGGDVKGGNVTDDSISVYGYGQGGSAINADETATVKVKGNATGGNTNAKGGQGGHGIRIFVAARKKGVTRGSITVDGTVAAGKGLGTDGKAGNAVFYNVTFQPEKLTLSLGQNNAQGIEEVRINANILMYQIGFFAWENDVQNATNRMVELSNEVYNQLVAWGLDTEAGLNGATPGQLQQVVQLYQNMVDTYYDEMIQGDYYIEIPEITASKLESLGELFGAVSIADYEPNQVLADTLGAGVHYIITVPEIEGGKLTADKATAKAGEKVTLKATPDSGKAVKSITVNGVVLKQNADGTYSFEMPKGGAAIAAIFGEPQTQTTTGGVPKTGEEAMLEILVTVLGIVAIAAYVLKKKSVKDGVDK